MVLCGRSPVPDPDRVRPQRILIVILFAAALIRLPVGLTMGDQVVALPGIHDEVSYDALARSLMAGRGYSFTQKWYPFTPANTPTAHWSFLYPLYLAGVYVATGVHPLAARLVQALVGGVLLSWLVYRIGRRAVNETAGLIAAALAALYGYFIYYSAALMTETFFIVLVLSSLYLGLEIRERPTAWRWIALGLTTGMASLLRQTMLLFTPVLLLWLGWELRGKRVRLWHFAIPVLVLAALLAPWTLRNERIYGRFLLLNSNAGYALYASVHPHLGTDWRNEGIVVPIPEELAGQNEAQLDRALTQRGIGFILADPERYLRLSLDKALEYFRFWPSSDSSPVSNLNRVLSFGLYLPFMLAGLVFSLPRWRSFMPLYLFMVLHTGIHLLTWPSPRYRLPVDAVLIIFAGLALFELAKRSRQWLRSPALAFRLASDPSGRGRAAP
jgi:4-amino-4-deoxy-L-arabinose transferase-like glycosyltransferase